MSPPSITIGLTSGRRDSFPPVGFLPEHHRQRTHVAFLTGSGLRRTRQLFIAAAQRGGVLANECLKRLRRRAANRLDHMETASNSPC